MNFYLGQQRFYQEINQPDEQINLAKASLYFCATQYPTLNFEQYLKTLDVIAEKIRERLPDRAYPLKIIKSINQYLFDDLGFRGNSSNYYDPRNSFLNEVIDRRTGIPITLSVVYLEIAKRIDFPMVGIGMPGHFLIRPDFEEVGIFVDAFNQGEILFEQDCQERLSQVYQQSMKLEPQFLAPVSKKEILLRMLTNLKLIYINNQQLSKALTTVEQILMLVPDNTRGLRDRGILYYQLNELEKANEDLENYLKLVPDAEDRDIIRKLLDQI